jgi:hypothetical protein
VRRLLCAAVKRPYGRTALLHNRTLLRLLGEEDEEERGEPPEDLRVDGVLSESLNSFKILGERCITWMDMRIAHSFQTPDPRRHRMIRRGTLFKHVQEVI